MRPRAAGRRPGGHRRAAVGAGQRRYLPADTRRVRGAARVVASRHVRPAGCDARDDLVANPDALNLADARDHPDALNLADARDHPDALHLADTRRHSGGAFLSARSDAAGRHAWLASLCRSNLGRAL